MKSFEGRVSSVMTLSIKIILVLLVSFTARADDFSVAFPKTWKKASSDLYRNLATGEVVVLSTHELRGGSQPTIDELLSTVSEIAIERARKLSQLGIANYTLHSAKKLKPLKAKALALIAIESSHDDFQRKSVNVFEWQYFTAKKIYQITYVVSGLSVAQRQRKAQDAFDGITPMINNRAPASETKSTGDAKLMPCDGCDSPAEPGSVIKGASEAVCNHVPAEKRRKDFSRPVGLEATWSAGKGCLSAFLPKIESQQDMQSLIDRMPHMQIARAAKSAFSFATSDTYRAEVKASAIAYAEWIKNPSEIAKKIYLETGKYISENIVGFSCLNHESQARVLCQVGSLVLAGGPLFKLGYRVPLAEAEALSVKKAAETAMRAEVKADAPTAAAAPKVVAENPNAAAASAFKSDAEKAWGFKPNVKHEEVDYGFTEGRRHIEKVVSVTDEIGLPVGTLSYDVRGNALNIYGANVESQFRRQGVSEYLFSEVLKKHPQLKRVDTKLDGTNKEVLLRALQNGVPCEDAIRQTPAARMRAKFGFTKITNADCTGKLTFSAER